MKKEEEHKDKNRNQEDNIPGGSSELGEFGTEYEFFISDDARVKEELSDGADARETVKWAYDRDQSKTFFLPDFFPHED
jgi:hypothetical protein